MRAYDAPKPSTWNNKYPEVHIYVSLIYDVALRVILLQ